MSDDIRMTAAQEARFRVLERMRHTHWCPWKELRDCQCKAGKLMLALIESEIAEASANASLHSEDDGV